MGLVSGGVSTERAAQETLRIALRAWLDMTPPGAQCGVWWADAQAALSALVDRLEAAERERDEAIVRGDQWKDDALAAERALDHVEDGLLASRREARSRATAAESRVERLEEALREIERFAVSEGGDRAPDLFPNEAIVLRTIRAALESR